MRDQLVHRGPDAFGIHVSPDGVAGLGFRRLKIIDLSPSANQPMPNEDGSIQLVFNGEIYNFAAIRDRLVSAGHRFRSRSDTEVIVHLYEEKGAACVEDLDGMFALAIWDERRQQLLLARDRVGKKPLFFYRDRAPARLRLGDEGVSRPSRHRAGSERRGPAVLLPLRLRARPRHVLPLGHAGRSRHQSSRSPPTVRSFTASIGSPDIRTRQRAIAEGAGPPRGDREGPRAHDRGGRTSSHQRRAARRVPERRRGFHDCRRPDGRR